MNHGKEICKELKSIRRNIAKENGIEMEIPECTYKGSCSGTCPRCEMEVRQLENELARRLSLGKLATVAGIALTLAVPATAVAQNQDTLAGVRMINRDLQPMASSVSVDTVADLERNPKDNYYLSFKVIDEISNKEAPFTYVVVLKDGRPIAEGRTDLDGMIVFEGLPRGKYNVEFSAVGYYTKVEMKDVEPQTRKKVKEPILVKMSNPTQLEGLVIDINDTRVDPDSGGVTQEMEVEGVKVRVQY